MTTAITRRAYWGVLTVVFVLVFGVALFAQSRAASISASSSPRDLKSTLDELMRAAPATSQDLASLQQGGKLHWVTFWRGDKAQKAQMTAALRRNLQFAVPDLIHDAQASGGSISTTFKLYKDLTVVCESLDSLLGSGEGKTELAALSNDLSDINQLKEALSAYILQAAASIDSKNGQLLSSAGRLPKKVIVDDNLPDKPSPKKRHTSSQ